ncbi:unnamed protein product [Citrullus colocynthis]|uniref:Uncharacterized protein n=1 Tax=Citrullus colocynthis TaxID=252529 RepID=A0ABP0XPT7_9ROSI
MVLARNQHPHKFSSALKKDNCRREEEAKDSTNWKTSVVRFKADEQKQGAGKRKNQKRLAKGLANAALVFGWGNAAFEERSHGTRNIWNFALLFYLLLYFFLPLGIQTY